MNFWFQGGVTCARLDGVDLEEQHHHADEVGHVPGEPKQIHLRVPLSGRDPASGALRSRRRRPASLVGGRGANGGGRVRTERWGRASRRPFRPRVSCAWPGGRGLRGRADVVPCDWPVPLVEGDIQPYIGRSIIKFTHKISLV